MARWYILKEKFKTNGIFHTLESLIYLDPHVLLVYSNFQWNIKVSVLATVDISFQLLVVGVD